MSVSRVSLTLSLALPALTAFDCHRLNPGAWTHYSYAIHDALEAVDGVLKVETHLSNVHARESWRRHSVISPAMDAVVAGMGLYGYEAAVGYIRKQSNA
jgi:3-dehydroquinate dehydratase II